MALSSAALITLNEAKQFLSLDTRTHGERFKITNKELDSNVATITTAQAHGIAVSDVVYVENVDTTFDGTQTVTAVTTKTFSYAKVASNVTSTPVTDDRAIAQDSTLDAFLESLIETATEEINERTDRPWKTTAYTQNLSVEAAVENYNNRLYNINPLYLQLPKYPLVTLTSISFDDGDTTEDIDEATTGYRYTEAALKERGLIYFDGGWPVGERGVRVVWSAGYATVPYYIQSLAKKMVALAYWESGKGRSVLIVNQAASLGENVRGESFRDLAELREDIEFELAKYSPVNV